MEYNFGRNLDVTMPAGMQPDPDVRRQIMLIGNDGGGNVETGDEHPDVAKIRELITREIDIEAWQKLMRLRKEHLDIFTMWMTSTSGSYIQKKYVSDQMKKEYVDVMIKFGYKYQSGIWSHDGKKHPMINDTNEGARMNALLVVHTYNKGGWWQHIK